MPRGITKQFLKIINFSGQTDEVDPNELIIPETTRTINLTSSMTSANIQSEIDAVGKYIPNGVIVTFQFGDGTYTLSSRIDWTGFFGGGELVIQGNTGEPGATTAHTNQLVILNFSSSQGFLIENSYVNSTVRNFKFTIPDVALGHGCSVSAFLRHQFKYNYVESAGKTTETRGIFALHGGSADVENNLFSNMDRAIYSVNGSNIRSTNNDDTSTLPNYGLLCDAGVISKIGTQPAGSTANELAVNGGVIR